MIVIESASDPLFEADVQLPHQDRQRGDRLARLDVPSDYDAYPALAGTHGHTLAHAYAAIRADIAHGTTVAPDFAHAVQRHRLLDAIVRSAATGR